MGRRYKVLDVSELLIVEFLKYPPVKCPLFKGVPDDLRIVSASYDFDRAAVRLVVESDTFPPVPEGAFIPSLHVTLTTRDPA